MDDSGARHPDRKSGKSPAHGYDWFALGGILIKQEDEPLARALHEAFCDEWQIDYPIRSADVRGTTNDFSWVNDLPKNEAEDFYEDLYTMMKDAPVIGLACVIDRPGYNARYREKYGKQRWVLCKTSFNVAVERAAKYARRQNYKLRVAPERCNKHEDGLLKQYYDELRTVGTPFAKDTSEKYEPLTPEHLRETLYEFRLKNKTSPMAQFADLYLWPICMGGYHASNRPYQRLKKDGKLIECAVPEAEWSVLATKYSCFEGVEQKS
jgi:hypothetical protein